MGKISNMYTNQDEINLQYVKNSAKPKLKIKGIKDIATLISPNSKNYKLTKNQRHFQRNARISIATLAASLAIASGVAVSAHSNQLESTTSNHIVMDSEILSKDSVMENAENKLKELVYGNNLDNTDGIYIEYSNDDVENISTIQLSHNINLNRYEDFSYSSGAFIKDSANAKQIEALLDKMLKINKISNPSDKDLEELDNLTQNLDNLNVNFKNGKFIVDSEKEADNER